MTGLKCSVFWVVDWAQAPKVMDKKSGWNLGGSCQAREINACWGLCRRGKKEQGWWGERWDDVIQRVAVALFALVFLLGLVTTSTAKRTGPGSRFALRWDASPFCTFRTRLHHAIRLSPLMLDQSRRVLVGDQASAATPCRLFQ